MKMVNFELGNLRLDYMANFSPASETKTSSNQIVDCMERDSARGAIQPGMKILA